MKCIFVGIMNKALICIGSNFNKENNIDLCRHLLSKAFDDILFSKTTISTPYGENYKADFLNQLAIICTERSLEDTNRLLKIIEAKMGRTSQDKQLGHIKIDIDIITWNDDILKPNDMKRDYVRDIIGTFPRQL